MKNIINKGFTLIELLIVIAVLGILAVAVLSAIDPIEQINRSRDTGTRSDSEQLLSAIDRFYAAQGFYPWQAGAADSANSALSSFSSVSTAFPSAMLTNLSESTTDGIGTGELKQAFITRVTQTSYNHLYIGNGQATTVSSVYVCFLPKSNSFKKEATDRCDGNVTLGIDAQSGELPSGSCGAAEGNYICLP